MISKHTESNDFFLVIGGFPLEITWTDSTRIFFYNFHNENLRRLQLAKKEKKNLRCMLVLIWISKDRRKLAY